jgi:hypothetical protein
MSTCSPIAVVLLGLALSTAAHAAPQVTSALPLRQRIDVPKTTTIQVTFTEAIDPASVTPISFRAFGRWSGPVAGTLAVAGNTVTLTPDEPFFAGEWVTVNLSRGIENTVGEPMAQGYAWNFWIKAGPGNLDLTYDGRIITRQHNETWVQPYGGYAGDLDNDGWSDLTVPCEQTGDARIFMNNGAGGYSSFTAEALVLDSQPSPNEGADFNNDGEIDIVFGDSNGDEISVLLGDGTGAFPNKTFHVAGSSVRGVGVVDLNGDGWDDIVSANMFASNLAIFINNGDGTFPAAVPKEAGGNGEISIAVADANNDGLLDVFTATYNSPYVVIVLLSDGNGDLVPQTPTPSAGRPWQQITCADFNGDGNVDTAINLNTSNRMGVLMGNGLGGLGAVQQYATGGFPMAIDAADIDGDGDLELVSSNYASATWTLYENQGGVFTNPRDLPSSSSGSCAVMHDRDNDGDIDVTGFDELDDWIYFYENVGSPTTITPPVIQVVTLEQNHPNPFNPTTTIRFELTRAADATLAVYDAAGAFVATIADARYTAGPHDVRWNGTDARGSSVASGVYFYRLVSGSSTLTRKMVLLK